MACVEAAMPVPDSRKKVDELFLYWLSEPSTQDMLRKELANIRDIPCSELDDLVFKQDGGVTVTTSMSSFSSSIAPGVLRPGGTPINHSRTPSPPPSSLVAKSPSSPRARRSARKSPHGSNLKDKLQLTVAVKNKLSPLALSISAEEVDCGAAGLTENPPTFLATSDKLHSTTAKNEAHPHVHQNELLQLETKSVVDTDGGGGGPVRTTTGRSRSPKPADLPTGATGSAAASAKASPALIPRFYFPNGKPCPEENMEQRLKDTAKVFQGYPKGEVPQNAFHQVTKAMNLPLYWKVPLFRACIGKARDRKAVNYQLFAKAWQRITHNCYDDASRFVRMMATNGCNYLVEDDFVPLIQDIVDTHPGLAFLSSAPEFHQRYVETVICRIFYVVDRNWNGRITTSELRRSNFLQVLALLEDEPDINQITDYFSYEHFYVIYCKFWELDTDHDLIIDAQDLSRHEDHALTSRVINRLLSGIVTRDRGHNGRQLDGKMSYKDFIWFLLSEEDKTSPRSIEYWFRCLDIDGDGVLSLFELVYFYEEVLQRLQELNIDCISVENTVCQVLDMVNPKEKGKITLRDLKACRMTPVFFNTFINIEKYLEYEQRDPVAQASREELEGGQIASDWEKYAAEQYDILLQEEQYEQEEFEEVDDEEELGEDEKEMLAYLQQ